MKLTGNPQVFDIDPFSSNTTQFHVLGSNGWDAIGRKYKYVYVGASALVKGNLIQGPALSTTLTDFADLGVAAAAILQNQITVTSGATVTANQYANGQMVVSVTPGLGQTFTIKQHPAAAAGATCIYTLHENVLTALTTSSKVTLTENPYMGVIQNPTTRSGKIVGVALAAIPLNNYGWVGAEGVFGGLCDATVPTSIGNYASPSTSTAGCVTKAVTLIDCIGTFYVLGISAKVEQVDFRIP